MSSSLGKHIVIKQLDIKVGSDIPKFTTAENFTDVSSSIIYHNSFNSWHGMAGLMWVWPVFLA